MIVIGHTPEPTTLAGVRTSELTRVGALVDAGSRPSGDEVGTAYRPMVTELRRMQFEKCCYCEWREQGEFNDVEHFRPKAEAIRGPGFPTHGYWWLAWTWRNLLFACARCNRSEKNSEFPLASGSPLLAHPDDPPGLEQALLLDPSAGDSPFDHLRYTSFDEGGKTRWRVDALNGSLQGLETIRVLGLNRDPLMTDYTRHVERRVRPQVGYLNAALATEQPTVITAEWARVTRELLSPWEQFVALAYDALAQFVDPALRARWGLNLNDAMRQHALRAAAAL